MTTCSPMMAFKYVLFFSLIFSLPQLAVSQNQEEKQLVILTSFSPEFYTPFVEKFKVVRPEIKVQVLNKKTTAAIDEITRGNSRQFDLFWSSSPDAFVVLKRSGMLEHLDYIPHYLPLSQQLPYSEEQGWYYNFALSGVGYMWNRATLDMSGIDPPKSWTDLVNSRFYGQLAMSTPSRSGTNHLIVESILQDMGWSGGWRYLMQVVGNMKTITARSFSVPDGISSGRFGAGMVIDFLAFAKRNIDADNCFDYGKPTFVMPARIAALKGGRNSTRTVAFIDFLLSGEGQKVLLQPGINRLPVSREPFLNSKTQVLPLTNLIRDGVTMNYDTNLSTSRYNLVNVLFDELITYRLLERKRLWKKLLDLERLYGNDSDGFSVVKENVIDVISKMPIDGKQSLDKDLNELFSSKALSTEQRERKRHLIDSWESFVSEQIDRAHRLLDDSMAVFEKGIK